jgi:hypothetical protein
MPNQTIKELLELHPWMRFKRNDSCRATDIICGIKWLDIKPEEKRYAGYRLYITREYDEIEKLYKKLIKEDEAEGKYCLGIYYLKMINNTYRYTVCKNEIMKRKNNKNIGMSLLKSAASLMHSDALFDLALLYEQTNIPYYLSLCFKSAKLGNKYALDQLYKYYLLDDNTKNAELTELLKNNVINGDDYSINIMIQLNLDYEIIISLIKSCIESNINRIIKLDITHHNIHFGSIEKYIAEYLKSEVNNDRFSIVINNDNNNDNKLNHTRGSNCTSEIDKLFLTYDTCDINPKKKHKHNNDNNDNNDNKDDIKKIKK